METKDDRERRRISIPIHSRRVWGVNIFETGYHCSMAHKMADQIDLSTTIQTTSVILTCSRTVNLSSFSGPLLHQVSSSSSSSRLSHSCVEVKHARPRYSPLPQCPLSRPACMFFPPIYLCRPSFPIGPPLPPLQLARPWGKVIVVEGTCRHMRPMRGVGCRQ